MDVPLRLARQGCVCVSVYVFLSVSVFSKGAQPQTCLCLERPDAVFRDLCSVTSALQCLLSTALGDGLWAQCFPHKVCVCVCVICTFRGGSLCSVGLDTSFGSGLLRPLCDVIFPPSAESEPLYCAG